MVKKGSILNSKKQDFCWTPCIDENVLKDTLKSHYRAIPRLIKYYYFNSEYPETMTLKYDPKSPNMLCVVHDNTWTYHNKDYVLDTIVAELWSQLYNVFVRIDDIESYKNDLICEDTFQRIETFVDDFRIFCDGAGEATASWIEQKKNAFNFIAYLSKRCKP